MTARNAELQLTTARVRDVESEKSGGIEGYLVRVYEPHSKRLLLLEYATILFTRITLTPESYDNFCLFCRINNSTKKTDDFAFFIYFTFKDWKRTLLADGPRQSINALTLYSFAYANGFQWNNLPAWWDNSVITAMLLFAICFTVLMFVGSLVLLITASIFYVPLLCYIQGNLKVSSRGPMPAPANDRNTFATKSTRSAH